MNSKDLWLSSFAVKEHFSYQLLLHALEYGSERKRWHSAYCCCFQLSTPARLRKQARGGDFRMQLERWIKIVYSFKKTTKSFLLYSWFSDFTQQTQQLSRRGAHYSVCFSQSLLLSFPPPSTYLYFVLTLFIHPFIHPLSLRSIFLLCLHSLIVPRSDSLTLLTVAP